MRQHAGYLWGFLLVAGGAGLSLTTGAQVPECGTVEPVQCYIDKVSSAAWKCAHDVDMWQISASLSYARSGSYDDSSRPDVFVCVRQVKAAVEPYYAGARDKLANNKDGLSALKDSYSYWLTGVDLIPDGAYITPTRSRISDYQKQRSERDRGMRERLNRLNLEK